MTSKLFQVEGVANSLWSGDLAPVEPEERTWKAANLTLVLAAMAVSLPGYLYANSLSALGVSVAAVLGSTLVGSLIVTALAVGCGHAGVRYGIPFAVLARTAFGVVGARVPVTLRLLVCCAWVGIGCWIGAEALWDALTLLGLPMYAWGPGVCFALVILGVGTPWRGQGHRVAGALWAAGLLLLLVVAMPLELLARGWKILHVDPELPVWPALPAGHGMLLGITAILGLWLPFAMGAADSSRRVRSHHVHLWSVDIIAPASVLFSGVIAVTSRMLGGVEPSWGPLLLCDGVTRFSLTIGCLLTLVAVTLLSARSVFSCLAGEIAAIVPGQISPGAGRWLVCLAALLTMPWRWTAGPERYMEWLIGCSGLLAPVAAILMVEYFGLRRRWLNVDDLYQREGLYEYTGGWNWRAFGALATGWATMAFLVVAPSFGEWRGGAVWIGTGVAAAVYWILRSGPPAVAQIPPTPLLIPLAGFESEGASG